MKLVQWASTIIAIIAITSGNSSAQNVNLQNQSTSEAMKLSQASETGQPSQRERRSYIGLGGGLGIRGGETGLADGGFSILSRIGITDSISVHNSTVFGDQSALMPALTIGIPIRNANTAAVVAYPFIGGGININTSQDFEVDPLFVAGVDVPLADRIMATTRLNIGFGESKTDVGVLLGIGYRL